MAQVTPAVTTDATAYTADLRTEITSIFVCNTSGSAVTFRLFHDEGGTTYATTNALFYDKSVPANDTIVIRSEYAGSVIIMAPTDSLGVRTSAANDLTFSIYGVTQSAVGPTSGIS